MTNCERGLGYTPEGRENCAIGAPAKEVVKAIIRNNSSIRWIYLQRPIKYPENMDPADLEALLSGEYDAASFSHQASLRLEARDVLPPSYKLEKLIAQYGLYGLKDLKDLVPDYKARRVFSYIWGRQREELLKPNAEKPSEFLTVTSSVAAGGIWNQDLKVHIPMLDFQCPKSPGNLQLVVDSIKSQGLRGFILDSGGSYHFWGYDVFHGNEWVNFMTVNSGNPLVDQRFIKISQKFGRGSLRISKRERCTRVEFVEGHMLRHSIPERPTPRVVAYVGIGPESSVQTEYNSVVRSPSLFSS